MKINLRKLPGELVLAGEQEMESFNKLKNGGVYSFDVKLNQNYKLHSKMFAFFKFCAQHYYGDSEVSKDQVELTRSKLIMSAGYAKQVFYPDGVRFELKPQSLSYAKMSPEERQNCYRKIVTAAMKNIFHTADESTENQLMSFL